MKEAPASNAGLAEICLGDFFHAAVQQFSLIEPTIPCSRPVQSLFSCAKFPVSSVRELSPNKQILLRKWAQMSHSRWANRRNSL
jgi:hypothetical protein